MLVEDGAWCWFFDLCLVYYEGEYQCIYIGFVIFIGDIIIVLKDYWFGVLVIKVFYENVQVDDYVNFLLLVLFDGWLMVFFIWYNGILYYVKIENFEDIIFFVIVDFLDLGSEFCYINLVLLSEEDNWIYLFFCGGYDWKFFFVILDDLGVIWFKL